MRKWLIALCVGGLFLASGCSEKDDGGPPVQVSGDASNQNQAPAGSLTPAQLFEANQDLGDLYDLTRVGDSNHIYAASDGQPFVVHFTDSAGGEVTLQETAEVDWQAGADSLAVLEGGEKLLAKKVDVTQSLTSFDRDPSTGKLTKSGSGMIIPAAEEMVASPDGKHLYGLTGKLDTVVTYEPNAEGWGRTSEKEFIDRSGVISTGGGSVAVSPDGSSVYATGPRLSGNDNAPTNQIHVFSRNKQDGSLQEVEVHKPDEGGVDLPYKLSTAAVSPDGSKYYVGGPQDVTGGKIAVFERDESTGKLTYSDTYELAAPDFIKRETQEAQQAGEIGPTGVQPTSILPDGNRVHITVKKTDAVLTFELE